MADGPCQQAYDPQHAYSRRIADKKLTVAVEEARPAPEPYFTSLHSAYPNSPQD